MIIYLLETLYLFVLLSNITSYNLQYLTPVHPRSSIHPPSKSASDPVRSTFRYFTVVNRKQLPTNLMQLNLCCYCRVNTTFPLIIPFPFSFFTVHHFRPYLNHLITTPRDYDPCTVPRSLFHASHRLLHHSLLSAKPHNIHHYYQPLSTPIKLNSLSNPRFQIHAFQTLNPTSYIRPSAHPPILFTLRLIIRQQKHTCLSHLHLSNIHTHTRLTAIFYHLFLLLITHAPCADPFPTTPSIITHIVSHSQFHPFPISSMYKKKQNPFKSTTIHPFRIARLQ